MQQQLADRGVLSSARLEKRQRRPSSLRSIISISTLPSHYRAAEA
jgi:hypothetical protein